MQKTNQKFSVEKVIKRKDNKLYVKGKGYDSSFNNSIDKKGYWYVKTGYFPPYSYSKNKKEVELDSSNYPRKSNLKTQQV